MIQIMVLPRLAIEGQTIDDDTLVISISSPRQEKPRIDASHLYKFQFEDVVEEYVLEANAYRDKLIVKPMEYEMAESIAEIAYEHRDKKRWIIHCEAGISRSPAVAIALSRYFEVFPDDGRLRKMFPGFNRHVWTMVGRAMQAKMNEVNMNILRKEETEA